MPEATVQEVKNRLLASQRTSLRKVSQEMEVSTGTCHRATKKPTCVHIVLLLFKN